MANDGAFLDLATSTGAKLFKLGAEPLSRSFDFVDPSDLQVFLDLLKTKSKVQGWSRIFTVPVEVDGVTTNHSLLHNYGVIPIASVALDAATYVNAQSKVAQDSFMLFQCIFASLRTEFLKLVTTEALLYHIVDTRDPQEPPIPCGALLLKFIIMKSSCGHQGDRFFHLYCYVLPGHQDDGFGLRHLQFQCICQDPSDCSRSQRRNYYRPSCKCLQGVL
jgi:hypothetical protein